MNTYTVTMLDGPVEVVEAARMEVTANGDLSFTLKDRGAILYASGSWAKVVTAAVVRPPKPDRPDPNPAKKGI